ncbi:hypothetical protein LTR37_011938 [Vermiconidia calcicola]|uniref:Uncharacterized protein n=1 Tax=Vermiconidia calcicola TaxID=1690605 RepID=A0ACC3N1B1_9PEZI|nr:hypothetical protein LTR37_011938 [Vermiconidia calcicola]
MADLCLSVLKLSYATGVREDNTIPWTHLTASDIFVVVKGKDVEIADQQLGLRIVQGTTVLESLDVARYVDKAVEARRRSEQAGITPQVEQLPIFGITKDSLIALRYRLEDGKARRLQLRMRNTTECHQVVSALERRGMEFQVQRPGTARPGTTGRPSTDSSQNRPLTVQRGSPYFELPAAAHQRNSFHVPSVEAGSLSQMRPSSPHKPTESVSYEMPPPRFFSRDEGTAASEAGPARPTTAQIYRSYTTPSQASQHDTQDVSMAAPQTYVERPSSTSHVANLEAIRDAAVDTNTPPKTAPDFSQAAFPIRTSNDHNSSSTFDSINAALLSSDPAEPRPSSARPSTAMSNVFPDTLEHEIPPVRELPFKRPESHRSTSDKTNSRPATSALDLPPLPKPKLAKEGSAAPVKPSTPSPSKKTSPARPHTASPLKRSFETYRDEPSGGDESAVTTKQRGTASPSHSPARAESTTTHPTSPEPQTRKPSRMDELLARKGPLSERSTNAKVPRMNSLADAPHEVVSPPATAVSPAKAIETSVFVPSASTTGSDYTIRPYTGLQTEEMSSLREYASQSREDRIATLDEFMVANIDNNDFTMLCEDVENCWRRIALGL